MKRAGYVVAANQREADEIARDRPDLIHTNKSEANAHLAECKAPPTDPHYGNMLHVYKVAAEQKGKDVSASSPEVRG